jgi:hypothetical protein
MMAKKSGRECWPELPGTPACGQKTFEVIFAVQMLGQTFTKAN